ncbi:uncharacterized protein LOC133916913 [Phragmites australis]|uniref:uncharacterized protein LOC133916913 n=1 Tax=Phragmites australis TaxID=29695 RepID=UPI002D77395E|nr:uncharacterized protein LOC133916913 [Phragmites australis]
MRIRRYAARLLSASATTANPSSPPPPPAASWLHAAADDCCAFCEHSRPTPQEGPDAIKHKGHIAGRVPQSEGRGDERVGLAQRPPAPEAKKCKINHGAPVNEVVVGMGVPRGTFGVSEAALKPEGAGGATLVSEVDAEPAVKAATFVVSDVAIEQEVKCRISAVSESAAEPEVTGGDSLVNESTTEQQVSRCASIANEAATELKKFATVPGVTGIVPQVTGGPSLMNDSGAKRELIRKTSFINEASTEPELMERDSYVSKSVTDPGVTIAVLEVAGTGSLSNEAAVRHEVTGQASLVHGAAELEATGVDYTVSEAAAEPEDTGRASCNGDGDAALDEPWLPDCDPDIGSVQIGNAGATAASEVQPSRYDAVHVGDSVNSTSNGPVRAKSPSVEEGAQHDRSVAPSVSCVLDIVARSIGRSGRTDVICYSRRRGKRKLELLEVKMENIELDDDVVWDQCEEEEILEITDHCESVMSTAGSADVKLADIKKELVDNSATSKVKKMKINRFECNIDYCRMIFKTRAELSVHKKNMCTVKSCSRHFRSHRYLRRHQSIHNNDMPYKCPWEGCNMAFKWSWDRTEHFKVHAGVKPYKCSTPGCSKIYKFVSDFSRHRRRCKP